MTHERITRISKCATAVILSLSLTAQRPSSACEGVPYDFWGVCMAGCDPMEFDVCVGATQFFLEQDFTCAEPFAEGCQE